MGIAGVFGVFGDGHGVKEDHTARAGQQGFDHVFRAIVFGAGRSDIDIARPTHHRAGFAASNIVNHGRTEDADVFAHLGQHVHCRLVIGRVVGIRIFADVLQSRLDDFCGRIQIGNAARLELGGVFGLKDQIPHVFGHRRFTQRFFYFGAVDTDGGKAPGPWHQVFVTGVGLGQTGHDVAVQIAIVFELGTVHGLEETGLDLRRAKGGARHHDVVARVAGHEFGVQGLIGFESVVIDLDAGFFLEGGHHALGDVVGPVVNIEDFFFRRRACSGCGRRRFFFFATSGKGQCRNGNTQYIL